MPNPKQKQSGRLEEIRGFRFAELKRAIDEFRIGGEQGAEQMPLRRQGRP